MPCVSPLGHPAPKMSLREGLMRKGVKADTRQSFRELFFANDFQTPLTPEAAGDLAEPLEMVRMAPSAVNKQPWRVVVCGDLIHFYEKQSKGYVNATGWDMQKIDIGIAMYHFDYGLAEQGRKTTLFLEDPGLAVPENTRYIATLKIN